MNCPTCGSSPLLPTRDMAQVLGIKHNSLSKNVRVGILPCACLPKPGHVALFCAACVQAAHANLGVARQDKRKAVADAEKGVGLRVCRKCSQEKPLAAFVRAPECRNGRTSVCTECHNAQYLTNYDHDKRRVSRLSWENANRAYRNAQNRANEKEIRAIDEGKTSPICRQHGFSLALDNATGTLRAARLDKPIRTGERAVCHYRYIAGHWVVLLPPLVTEDAKRMTEKCRAREERLQAKTATRFKSRTKALSKETR